jgi:hypothetical protein
MRTLAALAYERGQEYDPAFAPDLALIEDLELAELAGPIVCEASPLERRRQRERERRAQLAAVPDWFSVDDLVPSVVELTRERFA